MGEELDSAQTEKRFSVVRRLAEQFNMSESEVKEYMELFQRMFDNLLYMGMRVRIDGVVRVEQSGIGVHSKTVGLNKVYVTGLLKGEYKTRGICTKYTGRRALSKKCHQTKTK